jgi:SAM-dependent methyltransferase
LDEGRRRRVRIVTQETLEGKPFTDEQRAKQGSLFDAIEETIIDKYLAQDGITEIPDRDMLRVYLKNIFLGAHGELEGKSLLDLGCGSTSYDRTFGNTNRVMREGYFIENPLGVAYRSPFEPWLPRILHELGMHVIGIDYGSLEDEEFEHYSHIDLLQEDVLQMIPDRSLDYVHTAMLWNSPLMEQMMWKREGVRTAFAAQTLRERLLPQIKRVLKPEGLFLDFYGGR